MSVIPERLSGKAVSNKLASNSKLIFRRLLVKLATECTFQYNSRFLKQVDGCTMGRPLSVTFSDIYMVKNGR